MVKRKKKEQVIMMAIFIAMQQEKELSNIANMKYEIWE